MGAELRVRLLGGLEVAGIPAQAFGSRKARTLFARLALAAGAPVAVDVAAEAVWGDEPPGRPGSGLAVLVSRLRGLIGAERIERRDAGYVLHVDWLDVAAFDELVDVAATRLADDRVASARTAAAAALDLARGPLLPEEADTTWAEADRTRHDRRRRRAQHILAQAALLGGRAADAYDVAAAILDDDPHDEEALRLLLRASTGAGRIPSALSAYERFRRLVDEELGVAPERPTEQIYLGVLRGDTGEESSPVRAPLPGRHRELAALHAALDATTAHGRPALVEVVGEAGIGKTRLLEEFHRRASDSGALVVTARCDELGRDLPLQPVLDGFAALLGDYDVARRAAVLGDDAALFRQLLGAHVVPEGPAAAAPGPTEGEMQQLVFRAVLDAVVRAAAGRTTVVVFDDAHVADRATLAWIRSVRRSRVGPLLLVAARRVEEDSALDADESLVLGPLDASAVAEVVGESRAEELFTRTGGHPLFLTALADADSAALPDSLRDSITDRARRAGDAAATLQAAAALGPVVDLDLLAEVLHRPPGDVLDDLEEGQRRRLLAESATSFVFAHGLVREALAASMSASRRALLHREAAQVLADRPDVDPSQLAYHARAAGDAALTARGLLAASDVASSRFDHETALDLLDEAMHFLPSGDVLRRRIRVLMQLSRYDDAREAAALVAATDTSPGTLEVVAQVAYYADHDNERAAALARAAADSTADPVVRMRCLAFAGRCLHSDGHLRVADEVLAAAGAEPVAAVLPDVRLYLGALRTHQGRATEALALLTPTSASADTLAFAPVTSAMMRGLAYAQLGRPVEALAEFDRSESLADQRGIRRYRGRVENCRGFVLRNLGRVDEGREWHARAAAAGASVHQPEPQAHAYLDLADDDLERGDVDEAAEALDRAAAFALVPHTYRWRHQLRSQLLQARLALATGESRTAADLADDLVVTATREDVERYVVLGRITRECARHVSGVTIDRVLLDADLRALSAVAGLDGWRVALHCAQLLGVNEWRALATRSVDQLAASAGDVGHALRGYFTRRADSTSMRTVHG